MKTIELEIPNKKDIKEFELAYDGVITHDIYFEEFNRDMIPDTLHCINMYGALTRSVALRIVWAMAKTRNKDFVPFIKFLDGLEDKITDFTDGWGSKLAELILPQLESML